MKIDWNVGDDRSYGSFTVSDFPTKLGTLTFSYLFDQAGSVFKVRELNIGGHNALPFTAGLLHPHPDIGAPHDSSGRTSISRFDRNKTRWTRSAVNAFVKDFMAALKEMAAEGQTNPWNVK